ncbi:chorion peroxidase [Zeugodacus cucurbitae]|uniref:chorion peroxidase n=1 Tax=Zeugodacus cucurbitae TaxID=28588 RepID=UPI0023D90438|nr:chorion peroxidase [Zeugodacus cucurbitae]
MLPVRNSCGHILELGLAILFICCWILVPNINAHKIGERSFQYLNSISSADWKRDVDFAIENVDRQKRLEENLVNSGVTIKNGGISHHYLLDALPNEEAKMDNDVARKLLAVNHYILNSKCLPHGINSEDCEYFLSNKALPSDSELLQQCLGTIESRRNGHNAFRRLLNRHYQDGIYQMLPLVSPLSVSKALNNLSMQHDKRELQDKQRNLAVIQWTQFIEHDLSKPVVTTMRDGSHIECCDCDSFELSPRHRHPSCAPLKIKSDGSPYGRVNCLNYVRSAVAVGTKCTFGAVEQLNQATALLDLSQLYGFTDDAQRRMRTWNSGRIKSTAYSKHSEIYNDALAVITGDWSNYCAFKDPSKQTSQCFMAGDSRVNNSPLTISIYTLFMRNHNQLAKKLAIKYPSWQDEALYRAAKAINIKIYRNIVFDEWLPMVLGEDVADEIKEIKESVDDVRISNEFGIAAMRFYMSMMPNFLQNFTEEKRVEYITSGLPTQESSNVIRNENVVSFVDQTYKPDLGYTHEKIDTILDSILNQHAMKLDTIYEDSLILNNFGVNRPTHGDLLAYDIQRGRDHGLRSYIDYLKLATGQSIGRWKDLERFIAIDDLNILKAIYSSVENIDLFVGGMAEINTFGAIIGPTFKYILAEQFKRIYHQQPIDLDTSVQDLLQFKNANAVELLCANSMLKNVPRNIFHLASHKNPLLPCSEHVGLLRP